MVATQAGRIKRGISNDHETKNKQSSEPGSWETGETNGEGGGLDETDESMTRQMLCPNFAYLYYAFKVCVIFL